MDRRDREAIEGLFSKLDTVEQQAGPRDAEAEAFIAERLARQPGAPYYMAQTIVMQEAALANQQARIEELERENGARQRTGEGGFLSRMLGGSAPRSVPSVGGSRGATGAWGDRPGQAAEAVGPGAYAQNAAPYGQNAAPYTRPGQDFGRGMGGMGGGGFLAGAAQTAMGVAGGVLLGNALAGMFTGNEAQAAEPAAAAENTAAEDTAGHDEPAAENVSDDGGGWFGGDDGGGGFDEI